MAHGRGAVLVQHPGQRKERLVFVSLKMLADNFLGAPYIGPVCEYDPRCEVVVIFMWPAFFASVYIGVLRHREKPPECFVRLKRSVE